jgi:predicted dehydrogenase
MTSRREFLGAAAAGAIHAAPADKIKMGVIGCGWYGMVDAAAALKTGGAEIVALCDIDSEHLTAAAAEVEKQQSARPKLFKKYEELLETPGLQAVIIGTPPHWHALPFLAALRRNLDIYCEKPLAYDVREGQAMAEAAEKSGRIVQIGFQRRQSEAVRQAADFIRSGGAGRIVQVDVQIHYKAQMLDSTPQPPPASLDWETWCGPGPKMPYTPNRGHKAWRLEKEVGNGHLVDWGIHWMDGARNILGESMPKWVEASGGLYYLKGKINTPDTLSAHFEFAKCPIVWRHRLWGSAEFFPETQNGIFFFGEKQSVFVTDNKWVVMPERKVYEAKGNEAGLRHMENFLECVRTRKPPTCVPADGWRSTATVQLAMISYQTGTRVEWDMATKRIVNNPAAAKLLKREYRAPYKHPYTGA